MSAAAVAHAAKHRQEERARKELAEGGPDSPKSKPAPKAKLPDDHLPPASFGLWAYQRPAAVLYLNIKVQIFVAALIAGNFMANIIEEWVDPSGEEHALVWKIFDNLFNVLFFFELVLNMYGFWFWRFWKSAWNVFDFVVVSVGMLGLLEVPLPGPLGMLRMLRAFRVFRLFKRVKSLNKLLTTLANAVPGVVNAFIIVVIIMAIYAILGVEFFMDYGEDLEFTNELGDTVGLVSGRGMAFGAEYFGNFGLSMYTMFQVLTGESWSEVVARPLLYSNDPIQTLGVAFYFASFNIVVGVVLINVVVAVLLEKMVDNEPEEEGEAEEEEPEQGDSSATDAKAGEEAKATDGVANGKELKQSTPSWEQDAGFTEVQSGMESLRHELSTVKQELRMVAETFKTMEPIFIEMQKAGFTTTLE